MSRLGGALTEASINQNRFIPKTISEFPSPTSIRTKYSTDEEDFTEIESLSFALLTTQKSSQTITVLAGFAYDNIYYVFDIEVKINENEARRSKTENFFFFSGRKIENNFFSRRFAGFNFNDARKQSDGD